MRRRFLLALSLFGPLGLFYNAQEDTDTPGVFADRIVFGQSAAFSGPAQELGTNVHQGIVTAFLEVNETGGVNGRRLELITRDDQYEPALAIEHTRALIEEENVFALIGAVGTPTSTAALSVVETSDVPFITPFTGAEFLRQSDQVINFRASYNQETEAIVEYLVSELGIRNIGIVYQDDGFGQAGFNGTVAALERRNMKLSSTGIYRRNTTAVKTALLDVRNGNPSGIVIIGAYAPTAEFIRWSKYLSMRAEYFTISFVGSLALRDQLGEAFRSGVFITQVVPLPTARGIPIVEEYRNQYSARYPDSPLEFTSLEGYINGRLTIELLKRAGENLTRAGLLQAMRATTNLDLGGLELSFGEDDNQGSDNVYYTRILSNGNFSAIDL